MSLSYLQSHLLLLLNIRVKTLIFCKAVNSVWFHLVMRVLILSLMSHRNELALVINLGRITVESKTKGEADYNVKKMILDGRSKDEVLSQMMSQCYDCFSVSLGDVQVRIHLYVLKLWYVPPSREKNAGWWVELKS